MPSTTIRGATDTLLVSVVMPCLNEAGAVGQCVRTARQTLKDMNVPAEVIVVDNGLTDGSAEIAAQAGARVIHERRRGYGAAYLRGFQEAQGTYLVMGDSRRQLRVHGYPSLHRTPGAERVRHGDRHAGGDALVPPSRLHRVIGRQSLRRS
jgi:cellulose synthase/poly-beta-1,6-N-acetylglucosamine synthase-like glycosyltransferase